MYKFKTYILLIKVKRNLKIKIGALGVKEFPSGYYLYVGSGRKNLMERIKRHLKMKKKKFWHIDYLLSQKDVSIFDIYLCEKTETEIVKLTLNRSNLKPHIKGFGSSDTNNKTHLFYTKFKKTIPYFIQKLG